MIKSWIYKKCKSFNHSLSHWVPFDFSFDCLLDLLGFRLLSFLIVSRLGFCFSSGKNVNQSWLLSKSPCYFYHFMVLLSAPISNLASVSSAIADSFHHPISPYPVLTSRIRFVGFFVIFAYFGLNLTIWLQKLKSVRNLGHCPLV